MTGTGGARQLVLSEALFTHVLGKDMYTPPEAVWEGVKNSWDSGVQKLLTPGQKSFDIGIDLLFFKSHPLAGDKSALLIVDNGRGVVDWRQFLSVGSDEAITHGMTDLKRIGRFALFATMKSPSIGYKVVTSTSATGPVSIISMIPAKLARLEIPEPEIVPRDDVRLSGFNTQGTFAAVVLPDIVDSLWNEATLIEFLRWRIPRRTSPQGFSLRINKRLIAAPPLSTELVIEAEGIVGHFERDQRKRPQGIRFCDARTNTIVAEAFDMSRFLPYPFGRPEITGDVFIWDAIENQNSNRTSFSPAHLASKKWKRVQEIMFTHFCPRLLEHFGEYVASDSVVKSVKPIIAAMNEVWGEPPTDVKTPPGITPPDVLGDQPGPNEGRNEGDGQSSKSGPRGPRQRRPRPFKYKKGTYFLAECAMDPGLTAEMTRGGNIVYLNNRNPLFDHLRKAPAALQLHVVEIIIGAIERSDPDKHAFDMKNCAVAVQESLNFFYDKQKKKETT